MELSVTSKKSTRPHPRTRPPTSARARILSFLGFGSLVGLDHHVSSIEERAIQRLLQSSELTLCLIFCLFVSKLPAKIRHYRKGGNAGQHQHVLRGSYLALLNRRNIGFQL